MAAAVLLGLLAAEAGVRNRHGAAAPATSGFDLYVVGDSTAAGEPYAPGITLAGLVSGMFGGRLAGREIRVTDLSRPGESVYPQSMAFERALRGRRPGGAGAVLVYAGHNDSGREEGLAPFELLRESFLSRSALLSEAFFYAEKHFPFLRARTRRAYSLRLRRVIELSLEHGLRPVLATAVSNLADMDPGLVPGRGLTARQAAGVLRAGLALEKAGKPAEALAFYSAKAAEVPAMRAYLQYRSAKCWQELGRADKARAAYAAAAAPGTEDNFGRAGEEQNAAVRALAAEYGVPLVDAARLFAVRSPGGTPGAALFSDGHHPNMAGYLLLAGGYAAALAEKFGEPAQRRYTGPEAAFRAFSYGAEERALALVSSGRWYFSAAARHAYPSQRLSLARDSFGRALALAPGNFSALFGLGLTEAAARSGLLTDEAGLDWLGKNGFFYGTQYRLDPARLAAALERFSVAGVPPGLLAKIKAAAGGKAAAEEERGRSKALADAAVGKALAGDYPGAEALLRRALRLHGGNAEALMTLCSVLAREGRTAEAAEACAGAAREVEADPRNRLPGLELLAAEASLEASELLASLGRKKEAEEMLKACLRKAPPGWARLGEAEARLKKTGSSRP
ncbi:MAG: hypothetical protein CVU79_12510 [Elusimicrobia bacterium HGW-Elusimicrobia-3]|nr:MAG: hypothetical protein CVU79_12510 [Elusimicrobia bacterium HGW-Elusimicrobia-3]